MQCKVEIISFGLYSFTIERTSEKTKFYAESLYLAQLWVHMINQKILKSSLSNSTKYIATQRIQIISHPKFMLQKVAKLFDCVPILHKYKENNEEFLKETDIKRKNFEAYLSSSYQNKSKTERKITEYLKKELIKNKKLNYGNI